MKARAEVAGALVVAVLHRQCRTPVAWRHQAALWRSGCAGGPTRVRARRRRRGAACALRCSRPAARQRGFTGRPRKCPRPPCTRCASMPLRALDAAVGGAGSLPGLREAAAPCRPTAGPFLLAFRPQPPQPVPISCSQIESSQSSHSAVQTSMLSKISIVDSGDGDGRRDLFIKVEESQLF